MASHTIVGLTIVARACRTSTHDVDNEHGHVVAPAMVQGGLHENLDGLGRVVLGSERILDDVVWHVGAEAVGAKENSVTGVQLVTGDVG
jgi:hypothetical protein